MKIFSFIVVLFLLNSSAFAAGERLSLGFGLVHMTKSSKTSFEVSGEFEKRLDPYFGLGGSANYIFSPSIFLLGAPEIFIHPFGRNFLVSASPLLEFGEGKTNFGSRFGTRFLLPLELFVLIPSFSVDFIGGARNYIFGLGIRF